MSDKKLNVGDVVYVYKDDFLRSFKQGKLIKGRIINEDYHDYGYHGSGDWIWDYIVQGEDGEEYYANHGYGHKPHRLATKDEIIGWIKSLIASNEEEKRKIYLDLSDEAIVDYVKKYIASKKKSSRELTKEIKELNEALDSFTGDTKGRQYQKGTR